MESLDIFQGNDKTETLSLQLTQNIQLTSKQDLIPKWFTVYF